MKTIASIGLLALLVALVVLTIAGFYPAGIVLVIVAVFALFFNLGTPRRKRAE